MHENVYLLRIPKSGFRAPSSLRTLKGEHTITTSPRSALCKVLRTLGQSRREDEETAEGYKKLWKKPKTIGSRADAHVPKVKRPTADGLSQLTGLLTSLVVLSLQALDGDLEDFEQLLLGAEPTSTGWRLGRLGSIPWEQSLQALDRELEDFEQLPLGADTQALD
ncbi:hypothetical protein NDU88_000521 [Pleurodeles waltl]|uniref:Uncharacterized protein n=1 Tax=Pleurodeles waltl TaxID=8319 RepID=A0AAV7MQ18_PLEWA|nr:hypothetical protein NDU88_000521 [Pleurodeles waltl]